MERFGKIFHHNNTAGKRLLSFVLAFAMVLTMLPAVFSEQMTAYAADGEMIVHFKNDCNWAQVYAKFGSGDSWNAIADLEYCKNNEFGGMLEADSNNSGWYSFKIVNCGTDTVNGLFNNGSWGDGTNQTTNFVIASGTNEVWMTTSTADGEITTTQSATAPEGWTAGGDVSVPVNPATLSSIKSPVLNDDGTVTFNFEISADTLGQNTLLLKGDFNGWGTSDIMTDPENDGVYSITKTIAPGVYGYKFNYGGNDGVWKTDSANSASINGNSKLVVPGLADDKIEAIVGKTTLLPATLKLYDGSGDVSEVTPSYSLGSEVTGIRIDGNNLEVADTVSDEYVPVTASYDGKTATVHVNIVQKQYQYTIYYYDEANQTTDSAALWLYGEGVDGTEHGFNDTEVINGATWLKYTWTTSLNKISVIPKSPGGEKVWTWQSKTVDYDNTAETEAVTIYVIKGDSKAYTQVPDLETVDKKNYVVVEYKRTNNDYDGWNIYTWDSGFDGTVNFENCNGVQAAKVRINTTNQMMSFCMRRSTADNLWEEKDGGDNMVKVSPNQTITKVVFEEGKGITSYYPDNKGYEILPDEKKVNLYYRDDNLFLENKAGSLASVQVNYDNQNYDMTYNTGTQRWEVLGIELTDGAHNYYYLVKETADSAAERKLDLFNPDSVADEQAPYSTLAYYKFDASVTASLSQAVMDYNDNNVLSVQVNAAPISGKNFEASSITVDLTKLGGQSDFAIHPELMAGTIAVKEGTLPGTYSLPVTVTDQYNNPYTCEAEVTVTDRVKGNDFDWEEAVIYFAVTDRFYDGSSANNAGVDKNGSLSYHGGDFAGLTEKLTYLQDLGINTIWITPIVDNSDTTTKKDGELIESTGYHGYWASDFEKLNPHLGTEAEFKELLNKAHAKGMKIMVDVVLNHAGYGSEDYFNAQLGEKDMIRSGDNLIEGDTQKGSLAGLPDFMTEDADVRELLVEWQSAWISKYDIDYYRVDTVKHVDDVTWAAFKNALTKINPDFKMIGEFAGAGYGSDTGTLRSGEMDSLLDFDFNDKALDFVKGNIDSVESFMENRNGAIDNTATLGAFTSSHDEDGLMQQMIDAGYSAEDAYKLFLAAASLQLTAEGQVVIYYGEEIGQFGENNYPYQTNRYDFDWSIAQKADGTINTENIMLAHYNRLLAIRDTYSEVMAKGDRKKVAGSNENGYLVFEKTYKGETVYVGINLNSEAVTVDLPVTGSGYKDVYGNAVVTEADGKISVTIPALSAGGTVVLGTKDVIDNDSKGNSGTTSGSGTSSATGSTTTPDTGKDDKPGSTTPGDSGSEPAKKPWVKANTVSAAKDQETGITVTVNTRADGTATVTELKKTSKKTVTVAPTVTVKGVEYTVTKIADGAFDNAPKATKIVLPSTVTSIGAKAFTGAKKVKTIVVTSTKSVKVSKTAFKGLNTKKVTIQVVVSKKGMSSKEYTAFKKALKAAGFKGTIKKIK